MDFLKSIGSINIRPLRAQHPKPSAYQAQPHAQVWRATLSGSKRGRQTRRMKKVALLICLVSLSPPLRTSTHYREPSELTNSNSLMEPSSFASATQQEQKRLPCNRAGSDQEIRISEFFVDKEKLHYKGFVVQRLRKRIKINEGQQTFITANASYVVLRRHGTTVRKFDGISHPWGNGADFGLFALLGGESKQLIVSLDVFRGGSQWVVELSKSAHVIYDGRAWGTGRESAVMGIVDLDNG